MTIGIIGITASFILLALLLLSLNLYSKWAWPIKAGMIIVTSFFYIVCYLSFPPLLGWPTTQELPRQFRVLAAEVKQPDKITGEEGRIYLWLAEIKNMSSASEPRAYALAYNEALHDKIINVNAKLDKNIAQLGESKKPDEDAKEVGDDETRVGVISADLEFYDMPDPLFPDK